MSSSYGLFRRMTGVGSAPPGAGMGGAPPLGWGGLPPSVVAVPAVVLEGLSDAADGAEWREISLMFPSGVPCDGYS